MYVFYFLIKVVTRATQVLIFNKFPFVMDRCITMFQDVYDLRGNSGGLVVEVCVAIVQFRFLP
jgi:hypothetical protein